MRYALNLARISFEPYDFAERIDREQGCEAAGALKSPDECTDNSLLNY